MLSVGMSQYRFLFTDTGPLQRVYDRTHTRPIGVHGDPGLSFPRGCPVLFLGEAGGDTDTFHFWGMGANRRKVVSSRLPVVSHRSDGLCPAICGSWIPASAGMISRGVSASPLRVPSWTSWFHDTTSGGPSPPYKAEDCVSRRDAGTPGLGDRCCLFVSAAGREYVLVATSAVAIFPWMSLLLAVKGVMIRENFCCLLCFD